ncbi:unnamed protein product [Rhizopus stolonifer]
MQSSTFIGELVVVALKAEHLKHQSARKQDPFCVFRVNNIMKRTKADYGGGNYPIWDDQVNIPIGHGTYQMKVEIFDKDINPVNLMAEEIVDLSKVIREKEHDGYFPMKYRGQPGGEIYLELTFYPTKHTTVRPQQPIRHQKYPNHSAPPPSFQQKPLPHRPVSSVPYKAPSGQKISQQLSRPPPPHSMTTIQHSAPSFSNYPASPVHLIAPSQSAPLPNQMHSNPSAYPPPSSMYPPPNNIYPNYSAPLPNNMYPNHSAPLHIVTPSLSTMSRPYPQPNPLSPLLVSPPHNFLPASFPVPRPMPGKIYLVSMFSHHLIRRISTQ